MTRTSYRVRFDGGSGFELAGIVDRPDDSNPCPVAVFSHCFTCNKDLKAIVRISRGLADQGIAVLRYDMSGLGGSDGDFAITDFTTNVADLRAAIAFAKDELGPVTAMVGHSFGGAASLAVAGNMGMPDSGAKHLPQAVVTLAAPSDTQHLARLLSQRDPSIESTGVGQVTIGGLDWTIRRETIEDLRQHDLPAAIARIEASTLLFHSPDDATVSFDHSLRIMGLIQNAPKSTAHVSLIAMDGADHLLLAPADIEFVVATTAAFLKRYASPD